ncbi:hypothetical protein U9M48_011950 [Paspalum notatum var. saurae]|uniref:Uncharacterized protein n=1 Tax=Paspalum notatum var. saurae TaxID=547442 RepID=A0AAQ3SWY9_PASNO
MVLRELDKLLRNEDDSSVGPTPCTVAIPEYGVVFVKLEDATYINKSLSLSNDHAVYDSSILAEQMWLFGNSFIHQLLSDLAFIWGFIFAGTDLKNQTTEELALRIKYQPEVQGSKKSMMSSGKAPPSVKDAAIHPGKRGLSSSIPDANPDIADAASDTEDAILSEDK